MALYPNWIFNVENVKNLNGKEMDEILISYRDWFILNHNIWNCEYVLSKRLFITSINLKSELYWIWITPEEAQHETIEWLMMISTNH